MLRVAVAALAVAAVAAPLAAARILHPGEHVDATVGKRVGAKAQSYVDLRWNFVCPLDDFGHDVVFRWKLTVVRREPAPELRIPILTGTSRDGGVRIQLSPGTYATSVDPFVCETSERRPDGRPVASYESQGDSPTFVVPDYCAWQVLLARGAVRAGTSRLFTGGELAAETPISVGKGALLELQRRGSGQAIRLDAGTAATVTKATCGATLRLRRGAVATARGSAAVRLRVVTPHTVADVSGGQWRVSVTGSATTVSAARGSSARAGGKRAASGRPLVVRR